MEPMQARYIKTFTVQDPDSELMVQMDLYKEDSGLMFAIEEIFPVEEAMLSPYSNGQIEVMDD
jgi:hypothetical protein